MNIKNKKIKLLKVKSFIFEPFYEWKGEKLTLFYYRTDLKRHFLEIHTENLSPIQREFKTKRKAKKYLIRQHFFAPDLKELNGLRKVIFK